MNTNPAPEHTWSLSSKEVKVLTYASGSDYVYALTEDEVSRWCHSPSSQAENISIFSPSSYSPLLSPGPPSPSRGVLQLHLLQCLHHIWRPVVWLVQCGEQVLQKTTVCQQHQFWWSEVGPDNRHVPHSGHCIGCEHFRRRDSLPKRDYQHCELGLTELGADLLFLRMYVCDCSDSAVWWRRTTLLVLVIVRIEDEMRSD